MLVVGSVEYEERIEEWNRPYILVNSWKQLRADSIAEMVEKECLMGKILIPTKKASPRPKLVARSPLTTNEFGSIVVVPTSKQIVQSTDEYGPVINPIKEAISKLPSNQNGMVMNELGQLVEFEDYGKSRKPLPTNGSRAYIYSAPDSNNKSLLAGGEIGRQEVRAQELLTSQNVVSAGINKQLLGKNSAERNSEFQGSAHLFNSSDSIILTRRTRKITGSTDYSVIGPDNNLLSSDVLNNDVNGGEHMVDIQSPGEELMQISQAESVIYPSDKLPHNNSNMRLVYPSGKADGKLSATVENAPPSTPNTSIVETTFHSDQLHISGNRVLPSAEYNRIDFLNQYQQATNSRGSSESGSKPLPVEVDRGDKPSGVRIEAQQMPKKQQNIVNDTFRRPPPTNKYGDSIYADDSEPVGQDSPLSPVDHRRQNSYDYIPDKTVAREMELLEEASKCDKLGESVEIIFVVESSNATRTDLDKISLLLLNFIKKNVNWSKARVGMVSYGRSVNVNLFIGNYQSYEDLKDSILSLSLIDDAASGDQHAFRTALQLFRNDNKKNGELIVHVFKTPLRLIYLNY